MGLLVAPVIAGFIGTLLPAFDFFPPLGRTAFGFESWRRLFELNGLGTSLRLSLVTGLGATAISLTVVAAFCAAWHGTRIFSFLERLLSPLLAVPHVTVAFGIAFLFAPSGWILRALSPWATGFIQPPDWLIIQDPRGLSLMLGLIAKEVVFLFMMTLAALGQVDANRSRIVYRTLGYRPMLGWLKVVFPQVYWQIRLPVFAVLAYSVSVVDVAIILAPTTPPPLAVRLVQLFNDPDLSWRFVASAGALLQLGLVLAGIAIWVALEWVARRLGTKWITSGKRGQNESILRWLVAAAVGVIALAIGTGLFCMMIWSFASAWRFPDTFPSGLTLANWTRYGSSIVEPLINTLTIAASASALALILAIGILEHEMRTGRRSAASATGVLYLPLLMPQIAFLFGAQILLVASHLDGRWIALIWVHLVFVFPYVFLSLSDPYRAWDERYARTGLCLGASPNRILTRIKLPMLLRSITTAGAVGFAVSVGLYLPTLFAGSGRFPTLTTEAVTLSTGRDYRVIGLYSLLQMALPFVGFTIAIMLPAWTFRHRREMKVSQ